MVIAYIGKSQKDYRLDQPIIKLHNKNMSIILYLQLMVLLRYHHKLQHWLNRITLLRKKALFALLSIYEDDKI